MMVSFDSGVHTRRKKLETGSAARKGASATFEGYGAARPGRRSQSPQKVRKSRASEATAVWSGLVWQRKAWRVEAASRQAASTTRRPILKVRCSSPEFRGNLSTGKMAQDK